MTNLPEDGQAHALSLSLKKPWRVTQKWHSVSLCDTLAPAVSGKSENWRRDRDPEGETSSFEPETSLKLSGGGTGIRTLGTLAGTHAFQACALDHYATPPYFWIISNFFLYPFGCLRYHSLLYAVLLSSNSSLYINFHGVYGLVDFVLPLLCSLSLLDRLVVYPI